MSDDAPDTPTDEIRRVATTAVNAMFNIVDKIRPPENACGAMLGVATIILVEALREGWLGDQTAAAAAVNTMLAERGLAWRLVKPS